jgi:zinc protease
MAWQQSQDLAGMFVVIATPKPGTPVEAIRQAVDEELTRIARDGPTEEELQRAKNRIEAQMIFSLEPVGGFGGRAAHLNDYFWERGDPGYLGKHLERFRALTVEDVREAAESWLANSRRVALTVVPRLITPVPADLPAAKEAR